MKKWTDERLWCLYPAVVLGICLLPLLAMGIKKNNDAAENRELAPMPVIYGEEGFNWHYLQELGVYFDEHFALRQELVAADSEIRAGIFGVSSVDDVIVGKDGWLYYTATLDDFQHKNPVSERMLFNMAHNVALMQKHAEGLGKKFIFTIAPNKNSLYGENMPDRLKFQMSDKSDIERLVPWLERENVNYVDLFALFEGQDEVLYYMRDSHWNKKGAVMVYDELLDAAGKGHSDYKADTSKVPEDYYGDLNLMLFPAFAIPEKDAVYEAGNEWDYVLGSKVTDRMAVTECDEGSKSLLMYRDSFGNSLLPLMAGEFSKAVFSQEVPYQMADEAFYGADIVILEKVERHLPTLGKVSPIMAAPKVRLADSPVPADSLATLDVSNEDGYFKIEGIADERYMAADSRIFVEVEYAGGSGCYEAFGVSSQAGGNPSDYGYAAYLPESEFDGITGAKVIAETNGRYFILNQKNFEMKF